MTEDIQTKPTTELQNRIEEFCRHLAKVRRLSAVRSFYHYLLANQVVEHNPSTGVRAPKSARTLPKVLDSDQASHYVDIPNDDWCSIRDHAMVELFYSSGLRLAELVGVNIGNLDLQAGDIVVTGKGCLHRGIHICCVTPSQVIYWNPAVISSGSGVTWPCQYLDNTGVYTP